MDQKLANGPSLPLCFAVAALTFSSSYIHGEESKTSPEIEEVLVLGSHIPRESYSSASPVFRLDIAEIKVANQQTMAALLNRYPQFVADKTASTVNTDGRSGSAALNLRGLGAKRNLILLNGRRVGPGGADAVVDINQLPVGIIQNVEILTGGASTTYGSDAMSGVVNFGLRRNYSGLEIDIGGRRSDRGDAESGHISALAGMDFSDRRGNISGFLSHLNRDSLGNNQRSFAAVPITVDRQTGELYPQGSFGIPAGYTHRPALIDGALAQYGLTFDSEGRATPFEPRQDTFNYNLSQDMFYELERSSTGAFASYQLTENIQLQIDWIFSNTNSLLQFAPAPFSMGNLIVNLKNPLLHPETREVFQTNYDPQDQGYIDIPFNYRALQLGNRHRDFERDTNWINFELSGQLRDDWRWTAAYTRSDAAMKLSQSGGISTARIQQATLVNPRTGECFDTSNNCSPANFFGPNQLSNDALNFLADPDYITREDTAQQILSIRTNGDIHTRREEPLAVSIGLEWRQDRTDYDPDDALLDAATFQDELPISGRNTVTEIYGEILLPILEESTWGQRLDLELGLRYSDYSNVGGEWTWKSGLVWQPLPSLTLRGSYNRAARSPNMVENYTPERTGVHTFLGSLFYDPCAVSNDPENQPGYTELCLAQGISPENLSTYEPSAVFTFSATESGNTDLKVETADTFTLGFSWVPNHEYDLSLSLDYYQIELSDLIAYLSPHQAFDLCYLTRNDNGLCRGLTRTPIGDLKTSHGGFYNISEVSTSGYDLSVRYAYPHMSPWGWTSSLEFSLIANHTTSYEISPGARTSWDCAGMFGSPCPGGPLPKLRSLSSVTYSSGPVSTTLSWQWLDSTDNAGSLNGKAYGEFYIEPVPKIDSQSYLEFNASLQLSESLLLTMGVQNLTDEAPPFMYDQASNTYASTYDVLGRRYSLGFRLSL